MKRFILIALMVMMAAGAWAQDLGDFQTGFQAFAVDMSATLSYNATVGNNWSDAYIGQFPRFGVGLALGVTAVPADSLKGLFDEMGIAVPDALKKFGLPIPAAALSAKIGGLILPFDFGIKAMVLPPAATEALSSSGIAADYKLFGANVRVGLVKEGLLFPDVSFGAGYNRLTGSVLMPLGVSTQSFTFDDEFATSHVLAVTDPDLNMLWTTDSFDFTLQVSKKILFIRPYAGAGLSVGKSTVDGGVKASMTYDTNTMNQAQIDQMILDLANTGITVPALSVDGFLFTAENSDPVLRVYGGVSFDLLILSLDLQATIVPATKSLGANAMIRIQL
ncbi:MAG: hypothetical protein E4H20_09375 [Spirochaetales bacterium]|nr:MAG: hypothetical protein E4H20_09375 [Spirochaetales bacterium]